MKEHFFAQNLQALNAKEASMIFFKPSDEGYKQKEAIILKLWAMLIRQLRKFSCRNTEKANIRHDRDTG